MASIRLEPRRVAKPWGRRDLAPWAESVAPHADPIGEIIFESPAGAPLLIKLLFTSAPLSVQVHPDDGYARANGLAHGKDEAWLILAAATGASVGIGPDAPLGRTELTNAIADGSIARRLVPQAVVPGDMLFVGAGTIHAIGAGLALLEIQQNLDLTYRLHDYGRPRELHIEQAVAVSQREPWAPPPPPRALGEGRTVLLESPNFVVERVAAQTTLHLTPAPDRPVWVTVIAGEGAIDGAAFIAGEVWLCDNASELRFEGAGDVMLAYPGMTVADGLVGC